MVKVAQASQTEQLQNSGGSVAGQRLREGALVLLVAVSAYLMLSLVTYSANDPGWSYAGPREFAENAGGLVGAWLADVLLNLFGLLGYLFPLMIGWSGWLILKERNPDNTLNISMVSLRWVGFLLTLSAGSSLAALHLSHIATFLPGGSGGMLGAFFQEQLITVFSFAGGTLLLLALMLSGFTLFTGISWFRVMDGVGGLVLRLLRYLGSFQGRWAEARKAREVKKRRSETFKAGKKRIEKRVSQKNEPVIR